MTPRNMPLPLELTKPVLLAGDLDTQFRNGLGAGEYDPKTQLCGGREGGCGRGSRSSQESKSNSGLLVIDVTLDLQIDDNSF